MKRVTWFVGGVVAGAAGAGYAKKKVQAAPPPSWRRSTSSRSAGARVRDQGRHVVDASAKGGPRCTPARTSCKARRDARIETLDDQLEPGDQLLRRRAAGRLGAGDRPASAGDDAVHHRRRRRSSTISGRRSIRSRVRDGPTELSLYRRDASNMEGVDVGRVPPGRARPRCRRASGSPARHGVPFVPRGSGTGLAGGAVPLDGAVVIATSKMNAVRQRRPVNRQAWVQPGVLNLDLTAPARALRPALRPRPEQPADVLDRRQRRQQLRRSALPGRGRHRRRTCSPSRSCCPTAR